MISAWLQRLKNQQFLAKNLIQIPNRTSHTSLRYLFFSFQLIVHGLPRWDSPFFFNLRGHILAGTHAFGAGDHIVLTIAPRGRDICKTK